MRGVHRAKKPESTEFLGHILPFTATSSQSYGNRSVIAILYRGGFVFGQTAINRGSNPLGVIHRRERYGAYGVLRAVPPPAAGYESRRKRQLRTA